MGAHAAQPGKGPAEPENVKSTSRHDLGSQDQRDYQDRVVRTISRQLPAIPSVSVTDAEKFLNDLKLSPFWKVEKNTDGEYRARARLIIPYGSYRADTRFLFEVLSEPTVRLPKDWRIKGHTFLSATVLFAKPPEEEYVRNPDFCQEDGSVALKVYERYEKQISPNSGSTLAIRLSKTHDIYLLVQESGEDKSRTATFEKLPGLMREVASVAGLPAKYRVEERYKRFFEALFQFPLKQVEVKRLPGIQDRDTFYGYFKSQPATSYEGINIRISHPVYCNGEGTRKSDRLKKAECLGKPYYDGDTLFFLIEDNAVYLQNQYNGQFGTFSGKDCFEGTLEILNDAGKVLYETKDKFKGWEQ